MDNQGDLFINHAEQTLFQALGPGFEIIFTANRRIVVSVDRRTSPAKARISSIFAMADQETILQLGRFIAQGGAGPLPALVKHYIHEKAPRQIPRGKKSGKPKIKGAVFDLGEIGERIGKKYFGGLVKTRLTWGREKAGAPKRSRRRSIRFGSYDKDLDLITIHPALDDARILPLFLEFVVYHEILHKIIPPDAGPGGRIRFHSSRFRAREREFEGYEAAREWEKNSFWKIFRTGRSLRVGDGRA